ncbi:MAG: alpha-galactosidase [Paracoccaceae bacterium]
MTTHRLDCGGQTLLVCARDAAVLYWGPRLPSGDDEALATALRPDVGGGMMDALAPLTVCPTGQFPGQPGLTVPGGVPDLRPDGATATDTTLTLRLSGPGLTYEATFRAHPTGTITAQATLTSDAPIAPHWFCAPALPGPCPADILDLPGRWTGELRETRRPWTDGLHGREARQGRSGHEHPPIALFPQPGATNTRGTVHAAHYAWPGGHRMLAEQLSDGRRQIQFGHATGSWREGTRFQTAELTLAVSTDGLNGIATTFQADIRDRVAPPLTAPRKVHYNCWEAVYFDHDLATLSQIALLAADLGAERFVLDDGWFGRRDDDTTSLGDWTVDARKWPDGLTPLIDTVHAQGMSFGLWVEPEMVNPDSDLARAHPDWVLGPADQTPGRHQMVLDLARPDVAEHAFAWLDALLRDHPIDYLKWDHNRLLPVADAAQGDAILALLARLRAAHPGVEIETCASGGGRIDAGILAHAGRVWLSDSNDAIERARIQAAAALWLPMSVTGSHVGPRHCHTSGRVLPMSFRARIAAQRQMGFEMDPRELTEDEAATLRDVTAWWTANRDWLTRAAIHRLDTDADVVAEAHVAEGGARFTAWAAQVAAPVQALPRPLRLAGLAPDASYRVTLLNPQDASPQSRGPVALRDGPLTLTGAALMAAGVALPLAWPATCWMLDGERL